MFALVHVLLILALIVAFAKAINWLRPHFYRWLSHLVDRYNVRPSVIDVVLAALQMLWYGWMANWIWPFLGWGLTLSIFIGLSVYAAILIERLRRPPAQESMPMWYSGEGKPEWKNAESGTASSSFSLFWVLTAVTIFCVLLGSQADRLKNRSKANRLHELAMVRMQELDLQVTKAGHLALLEMKPLTNEDLKTILGHKDLKYLLLHGNNVSDKTLRVFQESEAENLKGLGIAYTSITADGLRHLKDLKKLERLTLQGANITDEGLIHLTGMESLHDLNVRDTSVTGTGLSSLSDEKQFPAPYDDIPKDCKLSSLWITNSPLSDEGLRQIVLLKPLNVTLDETEPSLEIVGKELPKESVSYIKKRVRRPRPSSSTSSG